ncbi:elongation of very long chain fatty acids protein AAEL008004-like [Thrips palmi]|uniref:Elongation of very long chain fatty acids protein n=1 Tax=Thrips palmi TaxID=161013 RepID=A0A6P8ZR46_THRPL|nr:elongation of very long chain fatty acids protein AAEL008004-like [Thrips palmi]
MGFIEDVNWLLAEKSDPRCKDWLFMNTLNWPLGLCALYLFIVLVAGPRYMKNRPAYKLDTFIFYYNIYQVLACTILFWKVLTTGWTTTYSLGCQPVDYSDNPEAVKMLELVWWTTLLKLSEFIETVVFVLRKKDRQISFLHVYHHVSTFLLCWVGCKFIGGGMATFPIMPNSLVHIIMYTYYLLSINKNSTVQAVINTIKPYITIMQMVQFCIIIAHAAQVYLPGCDVPTYLAHVYIPNVFLIFYLFYDFYTTNFKKNAQAPKKVKVAKAS